MTGRGETLHGPRAQQARREGHHRGQAAELTREYVRYQEAHSEAYKRPARSRPTGLSGSSATTNVQGEDRRESSAGGVTRAGALRRPGIAGKRMFAGRSRDGRRTRRGGKEGEARMEAVYLSAPLPRSK